MAFFSFRPLPVLGLFLATIQFVAAAHVSDKPKHEWNWLSKEDKIHLLHSIPSAPLAGSEVDKADLQTVLQVQAARTPAEIAEARADKNFRLEIVAESLGPNFTAKNDPITFDLLGLVQQNESLLNSTLKKKYQRLRPYQAHAEVKPLFEVDEYSYPSGHSSGSHILADILSELFPEMRADFQARADAVGHSRVVAGVHYPSDVEEGKKLADALTAALLANPDFQRDLSAAKAEVANKKGTP